MRGCAQEYQSIPKVCVFLVVASLSFVPITAATLHRIDDTNAEFCRKLKWLGCLMVCISSPG